MSGEEAGSKCRLGLIHYPQPRQQEERVMWWCILCRACSELVSVFHGAPGCKFDSAQVMTTATTTDNRVKSYSWFLGDIASQHTFGGLGAHCSHPSVHDPQRDTENTEYPSKRNRNLMLCLRG